MKSLKEKLNLLKEKEQPKQKKSISLSKPKRVKKEEILKKLNKIEKDIDKLSSLLDNDFSDNIFINIEDNEDENEKKDIDDLKLKQDFIEFRQRLSTVPEITPLIIPTNNETTNNINPLILDGEEIDNSYKKSKRRRSKRKSIKKKIFSLSNKGNNVKRNFKYSKKRKSNK